MGLTNVWGFVFSGSFVYFVRHSDEHYTSQKENTMIQIEREKLEKVLDALEDHDSLHGDKTQQAITIIKDVLAQPKQEQSGFFSREAMRAHSDGHVAQNKEQL